LEAGYQLATGSSHLCVLIRCHARMTQKLEDQIFGVVDDYIVSNISLKSTERKQGKLKRLESNVQGKRGD
jgi:hypothetical protein